MHDESSSSIPEYSFTENNFRTPFYVTSNVICFVIAIVTVFLNSFVLWMISRKPRIWDTSLSFMWHLALSDTLNGAFLFYNVFYNLIYFENFYECLFRYGSMHGIKLSSILLLLGIGLERYIRIVWPLHYWNVLTAKYVKMYISGTWILAAVFAVAPFLSWAGAWPRHQFCQYFSTMKPSYLWSLCCTMLAAFVAQCLIYGHILAIALTSSRHADREGRNGFSPVVLWWKPTKTVLIVLGSNLITLGPLGFYLMIAASGALDNWSIIAKGVWLACFTTPGYVNNMVNPILYAFKTMDIGTVFKEKICSLCRLRKSNRIHVQQQTMASSVSYHVYNHVTELTNHSTDV